MRRAPRYYVTVTIIIVVSTVVAYTASYYSGPGWGYRSVPISLFKALAPVATIGIVLALLRIRRD